jgi:hypothetical protein
MGDSYYDPEAEGLQKLQNLVNEYQELMKMKQDYKNMKSTLEKSYPEFDETLDEEDDKPPRKSQFGSRWYFERNLCFLREMNFIKDLEKRIQDKRKKILLAAVAVLSTTTEPPTRL